MDDASDDSAVHLTIRLIMQGKEVGSIIGKKGEIVKRFREESGAKINISDGSCPERIVTVTGSSASIFKAFTLICKKFEEFQEIQNVGTGMGMGKQPITLRLIVPASQCGSLIGKGGSKIKEIREVTGASIQVASEMLPNSTERCVTISGTSEAITQCIYNICCVMLESPPKGATIPYRPKPQVAGPVILAGGQAYTLQGNYAVPTHDNVSTPPFLPALSHMTPLLGPPTALLPPHPTNAHLAAEALFLASLPPSHLTQDVPSAAVVNQIGASNPLASLAALGLPTLNAPNSGAINPAALAALAGSQLRTGQSRGPTSAQQTHEMTVPNELIGCIIGKGGTKIAEIRQISGAVIRISKSDDRDANADRLITISGSAEAVTLAQYLINMRQISGAMIRISNSEEREGGSTDRTITISGCPDNVALAQYLINMSVELQKANLEGSDSPPTTSTSSATPTAAAAAATLQTALPLAQLLAKPGTLSALHSLQALGGLTDLLGLNMATGSQVQTTGVTRVPHRPFNARRDHDDTSRKNKSDSQKFSPY